MGKYLFRTKAIKWQNSMTVKNFHKKYPWIYICTAPKISTWHRSWIHDFKKILFIEIIVDLSWKFKCNEPWIWIKFHAWKTAMKLYFTLQEKEAPDNLIKYYCVWYSYCQVWQYLYNLIKPYWSVNNLKST